jgi:hyperosmotically inducible protein
MKKIYQSLIFSMLPWLTPLTVMAKNSDAESGQMTPTQVSDAAWHASDIIGKDVKTTGGESVGKIADLTLDLKSGRIVAFVISSGGFLGIADTLSSVPPSAITYDAAAKGFKTSLTKAQLEKVPQSKASNWNHHDDSSITAADNTARNQNDMNAEAATPMDQGNSDADIQTTKNIRAAIMATDLSLNTKNLKIITKDGKVILRGVVDNESEHQAVLKIAKNHADSSLISDQISVKNN